MQGAEITGSSIAKSMLPILGWRILSLQVSTIKYTTVRMKQFRPFRLDIANECLWRGSERILLTPKAFSLLSCLVERAGSLVTQSELMDLLWPNTFVQPEVLKTHIKDLRAVLGDDARSPRFIETQHRRGYRFIAPVAESQTGENRPATAHRTLFGKDSTLVELRSSFSEACAGSAQLLFVTGEAGIGKTTLANSLESGLTADVPELRVMRGHCVEGLGGREPYYPLLEGVLTMLRSSEHDWVLDRLQRFAPTWLAQFPAYVREDQSAQLFRQIGGATTERMTREFCEFIEAVTSDSPMLLVLEDVHWADSHTVGCIESLARGHWNAKVMVVATYRPVTVSVLRHPIEQLKLKLLSSGLCREIRVAPLTAEEVTHFLEEIAPRTASFSELGEFLYQRSEGNPLFMRAALQHLIAKEAVVLDERKLTIAHELDSLKTDIPDSLRQLIELQIESELTEKQRMVLEAASVCGDSFESVLVAEATGMPVEEAEEICEQLARHGDILRALGTVTLSDGSICLQLEFIHSLYKEVLYRKLSHSRRARIHKLVGHKLESLNASRASAIAPQLAYHYEKGSEWERYPQQLLAVADTESKRFAFHSAIEVLEKALKFLSRLPKQEAEILRLKILAEIASNNGALDEFGAACDAIEEALSLPLLVGERRQKIRLLLTLAYLSGRMDAKRAVSAADMAMDLCAGEEDESFAVQVRLGANFWRIVCGGWNPSLVNECDQAQAWLEQHPHTALIGEWKLMCAYLKFLGSQHVQALREFEAARLPASNSAGTFFRTSDRWVVFALMNTGDMGKALKTAHAIEQDAARDGNHTQAHIEKAAQAWIHFHALDFAGTLDLCAGTIPHIQSPHARAILNSCRIIQAAADAALGNLKAARVQCAAVTASMENQPAWLDWYWQMPLLWTQVELTLHAGAPSEAQGIADRLLSATLGTADLRWQSLAWDASARVALALGDTRKARQSIRKALKIVESGDLPLANWRVQKTAMSLFPESAGVHKASALATLRGMADSLKGFPSLQQSLLSSPLVQEILQ